MINQAYTIMPAIGMNDIEKIIELYHDSKEDCSTDLVEVSNTDALVDELYSVLDIAESTRSKAIQNKPTNPQKPEQPLENQSSELADLKAQLEAERQRSAEESAKREAEFNRMMQAQKEMMQKQFEEARLQLEEQSKRDAERREAERLEAERREAERREAERIESERRESERLALQRQAEQLRQAQERAAREQAVREQAEHERVAREAQEAKNRAAKEALEAKKKEIERLKAIKKAKETKAANNKIVADASKTVTSSPHVKTGSTENSADADRDMPISFYNDLDTPALFNAVKQYTLSIGMANKVISRDILNARFGRNNIEKLITKSYLISLGKGVTFGNG